MIHHLLESALPSESRHALVSSEAKVGSNVYLGSGVIIYPRVVVGDNAIIMDGAVLGRIPIPNQTITRQVKSEFSQLLVGQDSIIGCNSVIYTGSQIGKRVLIADLSSIREGCQIGDDVVIGRGVMVLSNCQIGARSRIQDQCHLVGNMIIEEDVYLAMGVTTTNDNDIYISRFGSDGHELEPPWVRRGAVIGAGATLLPGVEIGTGALVGAGALVTRNVPAWKVATGVPARVMRDVRPEWRKKLEERFRPL